MWDQGQIWGRKEQNLLAVIIDRDIKFDEYIIKHHNKAGRQLFAHGRICRFKNLESLRSLMKTFLEF